MSEQLSRAPWTDGEVDSLNAYQAAGFLPPFTCGNGSNHRLLRAGTEGWVCECCDYTQDWAHIWMADGSWRTARINLAPTLEATLTGRIYPRAAEAVARWQQRAQERQLREAFAPLTTVTSDEVATREHALVLDAYRRAHGHPPWKASADEPVPASAETNAAVEWWNVWLAEHERAEETESTGE